MMMSSQEQQAMAWSEVCKVLDEVSPKWWSGEGTGQELAVKAIKKLASPPKMQIKTEVDDTLTELIKKLVIMYNQSESCKEVVKILDEIHPTWRKYSGVVKNPVAETIKELVGNKKITWDDLDAQTCLDAAIEIQELREALINTLAQCIGWQGEPNEYSCTVHTAIVNQARKALRG